MKCTTKPKSVQPQHFIDNFLLIGLEALKITHKVVQNDNSHTSFAPLTDSHALCQNGNSCLLPQ